MRETGLLASIIFLLFAVTSLVFAGGSQEQFLKPEALIRASDWDIVVAKIVKVGMGPFTNENPPVVEIQVLDVIRGKKEVERKRAVLMPHPHGVDWSGEGRERLVAEWGKKSLKAPKVGSEWILMGSVSKAKDPVFKARSLRYPNTKKWREFVSKALKK